MAFKEETLIKKIRTHSIVLCLALLVQSWHVCAQGLFLWEVRSPTATVYLVGGLHSGKADLYPMNLAIESAYVKSRMVAVEADVTNQSAIQEAFKSARFKTPDTLEQHITPALAQSVTQLAREMGLDIEQILGAQAWLAANRFSSADLERIGYESRYGTDAHFLARARKDRKKMVELETISSQFALLNSLADLDQGSILEETIESIKSKENISSFLELVDAWRAGDLDCFARLVASSFDAHPNKEMLMEKLYGERNHLMADNIASLLNSKNRVFIVVGAGHLVGKDSIPLLLRRKGFEVLQHWGMVASDK